MRALRVGMHILLFLQLICGNRVRALWVSEPPLWRTRYLLYVSICITTSQDKIALSVQHLVDLFIAKQQTRYVSVYPYHMQDIYLTQIPLLSKYHPKPTLTIIDHLNLVTLWGPG